MSKVKRKFLRFYIIRIKKERLILKKKLFDYLVNSHVLKFSSIEESFFIYKKLDKHIKLEQNILKLNYLKESPFPFERTMIASVSEANNLYLWFYKKDEKRYFPEALLLFRYLVKEYSDGLFIFKDTVTKIVIIKDKCLIASFVKERVNTFDIKLIEEEFLLKDNQTHIITIEEYNLFLKESFSFLKLSDFLQILNISIDFKSLINRALIGFSLPLLISSIILMLSLSGYYFYIQDKHEKLYTLYKSKQKNVSKIKEEVSVYEEATEVFNSFENEFTYSNKTLALFAITEEVKEQNMTPLFYIRMNEENIEFEVRTIDSLKIPLFTEKLFSLGLFTSVKNSSTQNLPHGKVKATMQALLKAR